MLSVETKREALYYLAAMEIKAQDVHRLLVCDDNEHPDIDSRAVSLFASPLT